MNNAGYYRRPPRNRRTREKEEGDTVITALTIQVILCVLLLLLAVMIKKADEANYSGIKARYDIMVTDPSEGEKVVELFSGGGLQRLFISMENAISSILANLTGTELPAADEASEASSDEPEEDLIEPQPELELVEDPTDSGDSVSAFDYNYLEPEGMVYLEQLGQGGILPVDTGGMNPGALEIPAGCTLARVVLAGKLQPPVTGVITSEFAYREHPITGNSDFHNGMDIASDEGDDVLAALPGEVTETGWSDIYGNYVTVRHANNFKTFYGHCSEILAEEGTWVRRGERIAKVGSTGMTTGSHLHFSVIVDEQFTDPYWVLRDNIKPVD